MAIKFDRRYPALLLTLAAAIAVWLLGPIPQDPTYHLFADRRPCFKIPNCLNVLSNLPFPILGGIGWYRARLSPPALRPAWQVFWLGVFLTGFGSAWYHLAPSDSRLLLDRLPMTLAFTGLLALVLRERFQLGRWIVPASIAIGLSSIGVWLAGNDLRLYGLVQFLPLVLILLFPPRQIAPRWVYLGLSCYAAAKAAELLDAQIFALLSLSGHTLKHLLAAAGVSCLLIKKPLVKNG
jgi:hypothetical protein